MPFLHEIQVIEEEDPEEAAAMIVDLVMRRLPDHYHYDPIDDIQVLCPMYRGTVGATNFNEALQAALNPGGESLPRGGRNFRTGDKVMQIRNNYDKEVFNDDIGRISSVDPIDQTVAVAFPERTVVYDLADLNELAGLCHNSPQEPGERIQRCGASHANSTLHDAPAESPLHGHHPGQGAGCAGGHKESYRYGYQEQQSGEEIHQSGQADPRSV